MKLPRVLAVACAVLTALVAQLVWVPVVQAHADLVDSTPRSGERVPQAPTTIDLVFNEEVDPDLASVVVMAHDGEPQPMDVSGGPDPTTLTAAVPAGVSNSGPWQVDFRVTSVDGHPIQGRLDFTVETAPEPASTEEPRASADADPSEENPGEPESSGRLVERDRDDRPLGGSPEEDQGWIGDWVLLAGAIVVTAPLIAVAVARWRRQRSHATGVPKGEE